MAEFNLLLEARKQDEVRDVGEVDVVRRRPADQHQLDVEQQEAEQEEAESIAESRHRGRA